MVSIKIYDKYYIVNSFNFINIKVLIIILKNYLKKIYKHSCKININKELRNG